MRGKWNEKAAKQAICMLGITTTRLQSNYKEG